MSALPDRALDALGNDVRRKILRLLGDRPMAVAEIAEAFPVSRPAISRHLAVLAEAGLIESRTEGTRHYYSLRPGGIADLRAWLDGFWDEAEARLKLVAANTRRSGG